MFAEHAAAKRTKRRQANVAPKLKPSSERGRVQKLEHELAVTKEYLQSLVDDHGRTNDELNAANEELVSSNEELQSINEELETAKEELQSTNEELTTVNDELHSRNQEVSVINSDLVNLLNTVDIPILILDIAQRIRRFTPKARSILNVVPSDVGRPLDDIKLNVDVPDLHEQIGRGDRDEHHARVGGPGSQPDAGIGCRSAPTRAATTGSMARRCRWSTSTRSSTIVAEAERAKAEAERANRRRTSSWRRSLTSCARRCPRMLMQAQMLRKVDDAKARRAGEAIERGTRMQVQLIDDLLDVSRIVAGKLRMEIAGGRPSSGHQRGDRGRARAGREKVDQAGSWRSTIPSGTSPAIRRACSRSSRTCSPMRSSSRPKAGV